VIEQGFGWVSTLGRMRQVMVRGLKKVDQLQPQALAYAARRLARFPREGDAMT